MKNVTFLYRTLLLLAGLLALPRPQLLAQSYQLPTTGNLSYTTCAGTLYDDGGPTGPYSAGSNGSVTLRPATAGNKIRLVFTEFTLADAQAAVLVFDGPSDTAPLLGIFSTDSRPQGPLYAANDGGALTVQLRGGAAPVGAAGLAATIACVSQVPLPDLAAQNLRLTPASLLAGAATVANVQFANLADGPAPYSTAAWYVSRDSLFSRDDILLQANQIAPILGRTAVASTNYLQLPASLAPGPYYVLLVMDAIGRVAERDETNNVASARLRIAAPAPDLLPELARLRPYAITPATGSITLEFSIRNQGIMPSDSSQVGLFFSTRPDFPTGAVALGRTAVGPLLAGASSPAQLATAALPAGTTAGQYYLFLVADNAGTVAELDETNNVLTSPLTIVPQRIDLGLQYPLGPPQASPGQVLTTLYVRLNNQGSELALPATLGYFLSADKTFSPDDVLMGSDTFSLLPYTDEPVRGRPQVPAGTAPGSYYLLYVADYLNQLAESNEANNVEALPLAIVAANIDLTISQPRLNAPYRSPDRAVAGQTQNLGAGAYLINLGTTAAAPATLGLYLSTDKVLSPDDQLLAADSVAYMPPTYYPSLGLGFKMPAGTAPGQYYVLLVADHRRQVPDTDRSNNVVALPLEVIAPDVDLLPDNVMPLQVNTATTGDRLALRSYLSNRGQTAAIPATMGYYFSRDAQLSPDDMRLGQRTVPELNPSTFSSVQLIDTVTVPLATPVAGSYFLLLAANDQGLVPETNKANNVVALPLTVSLDHADLTVRTASLAPAAAPWGTPVTVSSTVANVGPGVPNRQAGLGYYLSADDRWDPTDRLLLTGTVGYVFPGTTETATARPVLPAGLPAGSHYLLIVLDPDGKLLEVSRTNNVFALPLTITGPFAGAMVPASGTASLRACAGLVYDNGGLAPYQPFSNGTLTVSPGTAGALTQLTFSEFATELGPHYLQVYDGPSTKAPLLAMYSGTQVPRAPVTASAGNTSGALTLRFVSSATASGSGFVANIGCVSRTVLAAQPAGPAAGYVMQVAPVPVASPAPLRVQLSGPGPRAEATLVLCNSLGQVVATRPMALAPGRPNQAELPTAGLATGVYVVRLAGPGLSFSQRVVIE